MLSFVEANVSRLEIPDEVSLCIYISGCNNNCPMCHYVELQSSHFCEPLAGSIYRLIGAYLPQITCVCFMGEGDSSESCRNELAEYAAYTHLLGKKTALYSGRNTCIESWMMVFDYIKTGAYDSSKGPLTSMITNQKMYKKINHSYIDITRQFWQ